MPLMIALHNVPKKAKGGGAGACTAKVWNGSARIRMARAEEAGGVGGCDGKTHFIPPHGRNSICGRVPVWPDAELAGQNRSALQCPFLCVFPPPFPLSSPTSHPMRRGDVSLHRVIRLCLPSICSIGNGGNVHLQIARTTLSWSKSGKRPDSGPIRFDSSRVRFDSTRGLTCFK